MKIGIITLSINNNYGGILQAYALQTILKCLGHEVVTLKIECRYGYFKRIIKYPLSLLKRTINKYLFRKRISVFREKKYKKELSITSQHTELFINNNIARLNYKDFYHIHETDFNCFVVGSDQVWRPKYSFDLYNSYLKFAKRWSVLRIAYAVSFGTDVWEYSKKQTKVCRKLIEKFNSVSVREASGVKLCGEYFNKEAVHVLDPTMLLCKENYISLFEKNHTPKSPGNLLVYILDEDKEKQLYIDTIADRKQLKPFRVNSRVENPNAPMEERIQPPVENWLRGFYDAEFVITDSFHGCVFSILFNKPFIAIGNVKRGLSRFHSLLSMFGLDDRLVTDLSVYPEGEIDYIVVNRHLDQLRNKSMKFLRDAMN